jgi:hypothetical protein
LIQGVAVGADDFIHVFREHQVANLGTCVNAAHGLEGVGVPEPDTSISCSSSRGKQAVLVWAPTNSLDCSRVLREPY